MKLRLTQSAVDRARIKDKDYRMSDVGGTNLSLRVYKSGAKTYFFRYRNPEGESKDRRIGDAGVLSLKEARSRCLSMHGQVSHGVGIGASKNQKREDQTFGSVVTKYLSSAQFNSLAPSTKTNYLKMLNGHILPAFSGESINDIKRGAIVEFLENLIDGDKGAGVSRSCRAILSAIYTWGEQRDYVKYHMVRGIKNILPQRPRKRVLTDDEIFHLWQMMSFGRQPEEVRLLAKFIILTAQRVGETSQMLISDVDFQNRTWRIPGSNTKNNRDHSVPLSDLAMEIIVKAIGRRKKGKVFQICDRTLTRVLSRYKTDYRFQGKFTAHDLRRTFSTSIHRVVQGTSDDLVRRVVNHSAVSSGAMAHYNHYEYLQEKRDLLQAWSDHIESLVTKPINAI